MADDAGGQEIPVVRVLLLAVRSVDLLAVCDGIEDAQDWRWVAVLGLPVLQILLALGISFLNTAPGGSFLDSLAFFTSPFAASSLRNADSRPPGVCAFLTSRRASSCSFSV